MKKCAVIIGINQTENMPPLAGAVAGAQQFAAWATSQNYDVILHTDEHNPVTFDEVFSSVDSFVCTRKYSTMVIFFSGHGTWKGAGTETWLLSKPASKPGQAIEVYPSAYLTTGCGIAHVAFISDACRSPVTDRSILNATGHPLFTFKDSAVDTKTDLIFSTRPGESSYETRSTEDSTKAFGIFTDLILAGLNGHVPEIMTPLRRKMGVQKMVIEANSLYDYLWDKLPSEVAKKDPNLVQRPHSWICSRLPKYLSEFIGSISLGIMETKENIVSEPNKVYQRQPIQQKASPLFRDDLYEKAVLESLLGTDPGFDPGEYFEFVGETNQFILNLEYRRAGGNFVFYNNENVMPDRQQDRAAVVSPIWSDLQLFNNNQHIKAVPSNSIARRPTTTLGQSENKDGNLFLPLSNENILLLPVLKDFVSKVWMRAGKVMHISIQPSPENEKFGGYAHYINYIDQRISLMISVAHTGINKPFHGVGGFEQLADYLRRGKSFDPVLGMYAAYMYAQSGLKKDVLSVYRYMLREPEPVLFDVQILAMAVGARQSRPQDDHILRTGYPILTQGWPYLSEQVFIFRPDLRKLSKCLVPGLWTTFTPQARETLL